MHVNSICILIQSGLTNTGPYTCTCISYSYDHVKSEVKFKGRRKGFHQMHFIVQNLVLVKCATYKLPFPLPIVSSDLR